MKKDKNILFKIGLPIICIFLVIYYWQNIITAIIAKIPITKAVIKLAEEQVLINSWLVDKIILLIEIIHKNAIASIFSNLELSINNSSFPKFNYISIFY